MGWGKKIGIGCAVFACFALIVLIAAYRLFISPITSTIGNMTGQGGEVAEIIKEINEKYPFQIGSIQSFDENRFLTFLDAREEAFSVFDTFKKKVEQKDEVDLKDIFRFFKMFANVRIAHAQFLKESHMSMNEYMWFSQNITKLAFLSSMSDVPELTKNILSKEVFLNAFESFEEAFDHFPLEEEQKKEILQAKEEFNKLRVKLENNQDEFKNAIDYWSENNLLIAEKYKSRLIKTFVMIYFGI